MKNSTKLRLVGIFIVLFNLWLVGQYDIEGFPVLLMTVGFALVFEYALVRPVLRAKGDK